VPPLQDLQTYGHCHTAQIAPHGGTAAQPAARPDCNASCGSSLARLWMKASRCLKVATSSSSAHWKVSFFGASSAAQRSRLTLQ
jgi:hypothetical protein